MSNYVTHEELRRALEAMRAWHETATCDFGSFPQTRLQSVVASNAVSKALATLPQQPEPQPIAYCFCDDYDGDNADCRIHNPRTEAKPDPLSPAAFKGRTTPDGKPVRWVAWDETSKWCAEYSTDGPPNRDGFRQLVNPGGSFNSRHDLTNPARAGQTLWVGQGPDPRERDITSSSAIGATIDAILTKPSRPLTLADIPAELRAEIEAEERERCAQAVETISIARAYSGGPIPPCESAAKIRALGPREVKP
jgi:hypothetical protein